MSLSLTYVIKSHMQQFIPTDDGPMRNSCLSQVGKLQTHTPLRPGVDITTVSSAAPAHHRCHHYTEERGDTRSIKLVLGTVSGVGCCAGSGATAETCLEDHVAVMSVNMGNNSINEH